MYVNGYVMLLFDLTPNHGASDGHNSHHDSGFRRGLRRHYLPQPRAYYTRNTTVAHAPIVAKRHD